MILLSVLCGSFFFQQLKGTIRARASLTQVKMFVTYTNSFYYARVLDYGVKTVGDRAEGCVLWESSFQARAPARDCSSPTSAANVPCSCPFQTCMSLLLSQGADIIIS